MTRTKFYGKVAKIFIFKLTVLNRSPHIMRVYDVNGDGVVDFKELLVANHIMSCGSSLENLETIFRFFDINGDGYLERQEMDQVIKDLNVRNTQDNIATSEVFEEMDSDMDNKISFQEFKEACIIHRKKCSVMLTIMVLNLFLDT